MILTGTQAYGPVTDSSDFDIVVEPDNQAGVIVELLTLLKINIKFSKEIDPSYEGFYFPLNQYQKVQIIVPNDYQEYRAWRIATHRMKINHPNIPDRHKRISTFRDIWNKIYHRKEE